jgi:hypothetical protein
MVETLRGHRCSPSLSRLLAAPRKHRRSSSLSRLLAVAVLGLDLAVCAVAVGVGAAVPAAVAVAVAVVVVSCGQVVRSLRHTVASADEAVMLGLLAAIISAVIWAENVICSAALKAEQRAFALAGAGLAGEQQALAWIPGIMPGSALVNSTAGGTSRGWARPHGACMRAK